MVTLKEFEDQNFYAVARVPRETVLGSIPGYFTEKTKRMEICLASEVDELKDSEDSDKEYIFFIME